MITLRQPKVVTQLEPDFLAGIHEQFPDQATGTEWYRDGRPAYKPELMEALQPLAEFILDRETWLGVKPYAVFFSVDTQPVPPEQAQRGGHWHRDHGAGAAYMAADTIPTEFLVRPGWRRTTPAEKMARLGLVYNAIHYEQLDDEEVTARQMNVYQPKPHELVKMTRHIHRSPANQTGETLPRTWVRASVLRSKAQVGK